MKHPLISFKTNRWNYSLVQEQTPLCTSQSSLGAAGIQILPRGFLSFSERHNLCLWTAFHTWSQIACITTTIVKSHTPESCLTLVRGQSHVIEWTFEASASKPFEKGCVCLRLISFHSHKQGEFFFSSHFSSHQQIALHMPGIWEPRHSFFWNEGSNSSQLLEVLLSSAGFGMSPTPHSRSPTLGVSREQIQLDFSWEGWQGKLPRALAWGKCRPKPVSLVLVTEFWPLEGWFLKNVLMEVCSRHKLVEISNSLICWI